MVLLLIITVMIHRISSTDYVGSVSSGLYSPNYDTNLVIGDTIYSPNYNTRFKLNINGEMILQININSIWTTQWTNNVISGTNAILAIQYDGNLVVYDRPKWDQKCCTWTAASNNYFPPQRLIVNNDGTANMMDANNNIHWSTSAPTRYRCQGAYACTPTMVHGHSTVSPYKTPTDRPTFNASLNPTTITYTTPNTISNLSFAYASNSWMIIAFVFICLLVVALIVICYLLYFIKCSNQQKVSAPQGVYVKQIEGTKVISGLQ